MSLAEASSDSWSALFFGDEGVGLTREEAVTVLFLHGQIEENEKPKS
jgi:tRNA C32,U32 (ribose-2'-O)-methylase TrmJ